QPLLDHLEIRVACNRVWDLPDPARHWCIGDSSHAISSYSCSLDSGPDCDVSQGGNRPLQAALTLLLRQLWLRAVTSRGCWGRRRAAEKPDHLIELAFDGFEPALEAADVRPDGCGRSPRRCEPGLSLRVAGDNQAVAWENLIVRRGIALVDNRIV